jgi:hypothetical protein
MNSDKVVIWIGARRGVALGDVCFETFLPDTKLKPEYFVSHDLECKWMKSIQAHWTRLEGKPVKAPRCKAKDVPADIRKCQKCGGGG